jgi:callose synthase
LHDSCRTQLTKAYQTASVLFEVLKAVTQQHAVEVDHEVPYQVITSSFYYFFVLFDNKLCWTLIIAYFVCLKILETADKVKEKTKIYLPFNILPLDPDSGNQAVMRFPEVVF